MTALMYACSSGNLDIVRMLNSECNANIDIQNKVAALSRPRLCGHHFYFAMALLLLVLVLLSLLRFVHLLSRR